MIFPLEQTIHMKYHAFFFLKKKYNLKMPLLKIISGALRVILYAWYMNFTVTGLMIFAGDKMKKNEDKEVTQFYKVERPDY